MALLSRVFVSLYPKNMKTLSLLLYVAKERIPVLELYNKAGYLGRVQIEGTEVCGIVE